MAVECSPSVAEPLAVVGLVVVLAFVFALVIGLADAGYGHMREWRRARLLKRAAVRLDGRPGDDPARRHHS